MNGNRKVIGFDEFQRDFGTCARPGLEGRYPYEGFVEEFMSDGADDLPNISLALDSDETKDGLIRRFYFETAVDVDDTGGVTVTYTGYA